MRRLPQLSTYDRRERVISTLATPLALHGVAIAGEGARLAAARERASSGRVGIGARVAGQGGHVHRPFQGASRVPNHARAVRAPPLAGPLGPAAGGHSGLGSGYLGIRGSPARDQPGRARAPHGGLPGLDHARGLMVLGHPRARTPPTLYVGAAPPAPAPGAGQPSLPLLAPA